MIGAEGQSREKLDEINRRVVGEVNRFYHSARQNSENAVEGQWKQHKALSNKAGRIEYQSNNGREVMTIRLDPRFVELIEEPKKPPPERKAWDWLVLELEMPCYVAGTPSAIYELEVSARFWSPPLPNIYEDGVVPSDENPDPPIIFGGESLQRFARDTQSYGSGAQQEPMLAMEQENPRLLFGGALKAEQIGDLPDVANSANLIKSSLLVDLRPNFYEDLIHIDLWGSLNVRSPSKSLAAIIQREPSLDASPLYYSPRITAWWTGSGTLTWLQETFPAMYASVHVFDQATTAELNELFPTPYTTLTITDAILSNPANFEMTGYSWLSNRGGIIGQEILASWRNPSPPAPNPPPWSGGAWGTWEWGDWPLARDIATNLTDANFGGPLAGLGLQVVSQKSQAFWFVTGAPIESWGAGDPGTPPADVGFQAPLGGSGPDDFTSYNFAQANVSYIYRASLGLLSFAAAGLREATAALKGVALRGQILAVPEPSEAVPNPSDNGLLMWSKQRVTATEQVYTEISAGSLEANDYGQWEQKSMYPDRWTLTSVPGGEAIVLSNEDASAEPTTHSMIGYDRYLGRVAFSQMNGGAGFRFTPAAEMPLDELPEMPE